MAISLGTETVAVTTVERTWRVDIETQLGTDPVITVFRQTVKTDPAGAVISTEDAPAAQRCLSHVAAETQDFTPSQAGKITAVELAQLVADRADLWRKQDIGNP